MKKIFILILLITGIVLHSNAQCGGTTLTVLNPSFEGTPQPHVTPPNWDVCMPGTTPDTQPGSWGVTLPASNGSTYIGLVNQPSTGWLEGAGQTLSAPMIAGTTYHFTIDLAVPANPQSGVGILQPPYCVELQLWGGTAGANSGCDQSELLWTSPPISNTTWQTYTLTFTPTQNWNHILFNIYSIPPPCTDGQYIMLDNMTPIIPQGDVAQFIWNDVCSGTAMNFVDSSYSVLGIITNWSWDFGDGNTSTSQNPSHNFLNPGLYNVTLTVYSNVPCTTSVTHGVNVWDLPTVTVSGGGSICNGSMTTVPVIFTFTGNPPWNLTYTDGATPVTVNGITTSPYTINTSTPGTYTVTSISDIHCTGTSSGSATVSVNSTLSITVSPPNPVICLGDSVILTANGADTYTWNPSNDLSATTGATVTAFPHTMSTYTVSGSSISGCTGSTTVTINISSGVMVGYSPQNPVICEGSSVQIQAFGASSYLWSPPNGLSSTTNSLVNASPLTTTTYTITGDPNGCSGSTWVTVTVETTPEVDFSSDITEGCEDLWVNFLDLTDPAPASWSWDFGDGTPPNAFTNIPDPLHLYIDPGIYDVTLTVTSLNGCSAQLSIPQMITVFKKPIALFHTEPIQGWIYDPLIHFFDESVYADQWYWDFGEPYVLGNYSCLQNPSHSYSDTGNYVVMLIITSPDGCYDTATENINIAPLICFYIPNAFTPNKDGKNDMFLGKGEGVASETFIMRIFNRWGQEVFFTPDINQGWDGRLSGSDDICPEGVYTYMITFTDIRGVYHKYAGTINMYR